MSQLAPLKMDFPFQIVRSKRKSAAIHVKANQVEVRIPDFVDDAWAIEFLNSKSHWVKRKLAQQAKQSARIPQVAHGNALLWFGESKTIQYNATGKGISINQHSIEIGAQTDDAALKTLQEYFKQQAKIYMVTRTLEIAQAFNLGGKLNQVRFRKTKSKWGHCTSKGIIQYNWLIMGAPKAVIDYLICHELSHLKHPNHSKAFWSQVRKMYPDYEIHQAWLKQNGVAISWC